MNTEKIMKKKITYKSVSMFLALIIVFAASFTCNIQTAKGWSGSDHYDSVIVNGNTAELQTMATAAQAVDTELPSSDFNHLHGTGNYVANTKYLYRLAMKFKTTSSSISTLTEASGGDNGISHSNEDRSMMNTAVRTYLNTHTDINTNLLRAWAVLGIAAHVVGDTYAHSSRVPRASVNEEYSTRFQPYVDSGHFGRTPNPLRTHPAPGTSGYDAYVEDLKIQLSDAKDHFRQVTHPSTVCEDCICSSTSSSHRGCEFPSSYEDCTLPCGPCLVGGHSAAHSAKPWCWCQTCFKTAVDHLCVEFIDLKLFYTDTEWTGSVWNYDPAINLEDDITFYSSRYNTATLDGVSMLINRLNNGEDFTTFVFLPSCDIQLNNLKSNILHTKTNWDNLQQTTRDLIEYLSTEHYY